jgi:hypothetical protein
MLWISKGGDSEKVAQPDRKEGRVDSIICILLGLYISYYLFYIFWRAVNVPVEAWDALSSVAFKAKVFFYERWLYYLKDMPPHPSYPVLLPLSMTWIAICLGRWSDQFIKIVYPCATLSFVIVAYHFLRSFTDRKWALLGVAMILSSNELIHHSTIAYRDQFLMFYAITALMLLILWHRAKNDGLLLLAAFFAGFGAFIKVEGTPYLAVFSLLLAGMLYFDRDIPIRTRIFIFLKFAVPAFLLGSVFYIYKFMHNFPSERESGLEISIGNLARLPVILGSFWKDLFISGNWNIIWFLLALSLLVNAGKIGKRAEIRTLFFALVMFIGLYMGLALFTSEFVWIAGEKSSTTVSRLMLHFYPIAPLLIALLNYPGDSRPITNSLKPTKHTQAR